MIGCQVKILAYDWLTSYNAVIDGYLVQHAPRLPHTILAGVQVQSLVLQDLPFPHDVLHLAIQEPGQGCHHALIATTYVLLLQQTKSKKKENIDMINISI